MPTISELITIFRKECEDLIYANQVATFLIQYNQVSATAGSNSVSFTTAYGDTNYHINFLSALDVNGVNITDALEITAKTSSGFSFTTPRDATVIWQTARYYPIINYPTNAYWT